MARPKGFEPLTPRFVVWCSIQLSYGRVWRARTYWGAPAKARTTDAPCGNGATAVKFCPKFAQVPVDTGGFRPKRHCDPLWASSPLVKTDAEGPPAFGARTGLGFGVHTPLGS